MRSASRRAGQDDGPELIVFSLSDFAKTSASAKADGFLP
jgi:hypothetical protein